jgi:hypothetical protein
MSPGKISGAPHKNKVFSVAYRTARAQFHLVLTPSPKSVAAHSACP